LKVSEHLPRGGYASSAHTYNDQAKCLYVMVKNRQGNDVVLTRQSTGPYDKQCSALLVENDDGRWQGSWNDCKGGDPPNDGKSDLFTLSHVGGVWNDCWYDVYDWMTVCLWK
jgi:hypothetical protein